MAALAGDGAVAGEVADTVSIGGVDVPLSALADLPDDVLKHIRRKVKSAGEEREVSMLDALDAVPKAEGWQKRQWEAAQREKAVQEAAQGISTDVVGSLMKLGNMSRAEATDMVAQQMVSILERQQMSPEDRARAEAHEQLVSKAARADEYERAEAQAKQATETAALQATYTGLANDALTAAGVRQSPQAVQRVASVLERASVDGQIRGDITSEHFAWAAGVVAKELTDERAAYYGDAEGDDLIGRVGEEQARKIARAYAKRVQRSQATPRREESAAPRSAAQPRSFETMAEWKAAADKRMGIG